MPSVPLSREYIDGIGKIDEYMIIILKVEKVLSEEEIKQLSKEVDKTASKKKIKETEIN